MKNVLEKRGEYIRFGFDGARSLNQISRALRDEFALHKLDHIIKIKHQNVYKDGFELESEVDAVFLDLPAPWDALEHAKKAMRASFILPPLFHAYS